MSGKKVLIITYYWPPAGGAGVQRWLKFVKYLPKKGWDPVIYTPLNGEMPVADPSLLKDIPDGTEVLKTKIWEPYEWYKKFVGVGSNEKINTGFLTEKKKPGLAEKISVWIRGNFFIPDARCYWIQPSVRFLTSYLKEHKVDAIVSTGPPHSMHLIAMKVASIHRIPWLADFRDPWTNIDYYKDLMLSRKADKKHHELEKQVISTATRVVVVGNTMKEEFESAYNRNVDVITNGFDPDDFPQTGKFRKTGFTIAHIGSLVRSRNPESLWKAIDILRKEMPEFNSEIQIRLTGKVDVSVRSSIEKYGLSDITNYVSYLPHDQVVTEQQNASLQLLLLNNTPNAKGILTGKLFEYMASGSPILAIGPTDGDAAAVLNESETGTCYDFDDIDGIKSALLKAFRYHQTGNGSSGNRKLEKWTREALTNKLADILDQMTHA